MWHRIFGNPGLKPGEGLDTVFVHTSAWPPWLSLLLLLAAAILIIFLYLREPGDTGRRVRWLLAALRISLIALILLMMYGWMRDRYRTDLPDLAIVLDDSASMQIVDQYSADQVTSDMQAEMTSLGLQPASRFNLAKLLLVGRSSNWLNQFSEHYTLKGYLISSSTRIHNWRDGTATQAWLPLEAGQPVSRLGRGIRTVLEMQRGRPTAAIVCLTDGITTEGQSIAEVSDYARQRNTPLFLVGLGDDQPARDLRVKDVLLDDVAFLGDLVHCDFKLVGTGFDKADVTVRLRRAGSPQVLAEKTVNVHGRGQPQDVQLSCRMLEEGVVKLTVEAEPLAKESNLANNLQTRSIHVKDEVLQVLFLQEYPSFEFRYLKTLLERGLSRGREQKTIQLTTVLQEADLEYAQLDTTARRVFPAGRDALFSYDVLIIGDANPTYLSQPIQENIAAFVIDHGGGLVLISGPRHMPLSFRDTPLERLFPIELETAALPDAEQLLERSFRVVPTRLGLASPQLQLAETETANLEIWSRLPGIRWAIQAPDMRPAARILAHLPGQVGPTGQPLPIICSQFVGAGEVVLHTTDESYLWSRAEEKDEYYERYWIQTIRRLGRMKLSSSGDKVVISTSSSQYQRGEVVPVRVQFRDERLAPATDDGVVVIVQQEAGRRQQIRLHRGSTRRGVFEGSISNLAPGNYRIWLASPSLEEMPAAGNFEVVPPPGERTLLAMNASDLQQAAEATSGHFYELTSADQLPGDLPPGRQVRIDALPPTPIWNSPFIAGLFMALIIIEWLVRRRVGWL
jgi:hypothetical protein